MNELQEHGQVETAERPTNGPWRRFTTVGSTMVAVTTGASVFVTSVASMIRGQLASHNQPSDRAVFFSILLVSILVGGLVTFFATRGEDAEDDE